MEESNNTIINFLLVVIPLAVPFGLLIQKALASRVKEHDVDSGVFFPDKTLLNFPEQRLGYSDRVAYVMGELSDLAYYRFEDADKVTLARERLNALIQKGELSSINKDLSIDSLLADCLRIGGREELQRILNEAELDLIGTINVGNLEAIICKKRGPRPYLVIAFRGSEKNGDWLVNAQVMPVFEPLDLSEPPKPIPGARVHKGFYNALCCHLDSKNQLTAIEQIKQAITAEDPEQKMPIYLTGHSLGGAWALLATRLLFQKREGVSCYSFGAPRAANYEFYFGMKAPVYRVVNSADIVPRIPPNSSIVNLFARTIGGLAWVFERFGIKPIHQILEKIEVQVDKLKHYRHYGDMRYLTDTTDGKWHETKLLTNPQGVDQLEWIIKGLTKFSKKHMTNCHSMVLYRKKLNEIANARK